MTLGRGKIAKERAILGIRDLVRDDLELLREKRQLPVIQRIRDPHHALARALASGVRQFEAAARCGYSVNRVSQLEKDPAFRELVAYYRDLVAASFKEEVDEYYQLLASNAAKAERMIADKLDTADDAGEALPTRELIAISRDSADRIGYGKKQTNLNVNVDFAAQLEKAIQRSGKVIDVRPNSPTAVLGAGRDDSSSAASPEPFRRRA